MNQLVPSEQTSTREIGFAIGAGGASIAPKDLGEVIRFAEVMCRADIALPPHLRGNTGACMAVALQALEWQMSPFAVASKSYAVKGAIAYEAQLIVAVVNTRSGIKGRLKYRFEGEGADRVCIAFGTLDGEELEARSPKFADINPKNSPLWKSDPDQQHCYYTGRAWARRFCPEVILGVYDRDEVETFQGADNAKDVTPSLADRLRVGKTRPQEATGQAEGFDRSFVTRETTALAGGAAIDQEPASIDPEGDVAGSGEEAPLDPAADNPETTVGVEEAGTEAREEPDAPASIDMSATDLDWLKTAARMLWAATGIGDQDVLRNQLNAVRLETPEDVGKAARDRGTSIYNKCKLVCFGEAEMAQTLVEIAAIAGCETKDVVS